MPKEQEIYVLGIDPGATGALVLLGESGLTWAWDWAGEAAAVEMLGALTGLYGVRLAALEKVWCVRGNSARSNTTFQQHVGTWKGLLGAFGIPRVDVTPREWGKGLLRAKRGPKDKPSVEVVERLYPGFCLRTPRGRVLDGRADAVLMARWALGQVKKGRF